MNEVTLQGRILNIWRGQNVSIVTLFVEQSVPNGETRVNFPNILINNTDISMLDGFKKNDFVNVVGTIKVRREEIYEPKPNEANTYIKRIRFDQYIKGILFSHVRTEMSEKFDVDLGGKYEYLNETLIQGTITNVTTRNGVINLLVKPDGEKFNVTIVDYAPNKDAFMRKFTNGSKVCAKCVVQTARKEKEGQEKATFYENLVVSYIDKKREPKKPVKNKTAGSSEPVMQDPMEVLND